MSTKQDIVLICTVGGSPQPIVTAIQSLKPVFTEFVCTDKDPGTGKPGSNVGITGQGNVFRSGPTVKDPDLPSIPVMAGIEPDCYGMTIVASDDMDDAFVKIRNRLIALNRQFPEARIVADYTGGTKTMTAALVLAVLETEGIGLQLVTGNRPDLIKVKDGTQAVVSANVDTVRLQKTMQPFLSAWGRFAYDEAAKGLAGIKAPAQPLLRAELLRLRDVSAAFAAWDRFDHRGALHRLESYGSAVGNFLGPYLAVLKVLTSDDQRQEPFLLLDLWRNAQRRAARGRFDDAMARCYRMIEWTAQWLLKKDHGIHTGDVPADLVSDQVPIIAGPDGKRRAGLRNAWELIALKHDGPAGQFIRAEKNAMFDRITARNGSILAHGTTPVDETAWQKMGDWMGQRFVPMLLAEAKSLGVKKAPPQLPDSAEPLKGQI